MVRKIGQNKVKVVILGVLLGIAGIMIYLYILPFMFPVTVNGVFIPYKYVLMGTEAEIIKYTGTEEEVIIPEKIMFRKVTGIAFRREEGGAFEGNKTIRRVVIPDSVEVIETAAFQECENLEEVVLPSELKELHYQVFEGCKSLEKITLPEGLESIMNGAFARCSQLQKIVIPQSVQEIEAMAFVKCNNLIEVRIPDTIPRISGDAFVGTPWYAAKTEEFIELGNHVLVKYNGKESTIEIPEKTIYIGEYVFSKSRHLLDEKQRETITQIIVPESVEGIGFLGIYELTNLETIVLYNDEIHLEEDSIGECDKLTIMARKDSKGHKYALENDIPWQELK